MTDHRFSTYAKFSEKTNISYPLIRTRKCSYQGVRNVYFTKNIAYVLNERPLRLSTPNERIFDLVRKQKNQNFLPYNRALTCVHNTWVTPEKKNHPSPRKPLNTDKKS